MVVPDVVSREHCHVSIIKFCVERRHSASMVGDAFCPCLGFCCYSPNWDHSSNYQPGINFQFWISGFSFLFKLIFIYSWMEEEIEGFHDDDISMFL